MEDILIYDSIDSTNLEAQRLLARQEVPHGTVLIAREQTAGRGQMGRTWIASPGEHLAMTLILKPSGYESARIPELGMIIPLAIVRVIRALSGGSNPLIKWPNDIYLHDRKLSGILIENTLAGHRLQYVIAGIGMNVNETIFPEEIPNAISLRLLTGHSMDMHDIAMQIRQSVLTIFLENKVNWKSEYDQCVFGKNEVHSFTIDNQILRAKVIGVDDRARLVLQLQDREQAFSTHQLSWIL